MSEPLNEFLETVEALVKKNGDDNSAHCELSHDAELGRQVRSAWTTMVDAEKAMDEFCETHHTSRAASTVNIPGREWPNDR